MEEKKIIEIKSHVRIKCRSEVQLKVTVTNRYQIKTNECSSDRVTNVKTVSEIVKN